MQWKQVFTIGNPEDFYIAYTPHCDDTEGSFTALYIPKSKLGFGLYGDWRSEYEQAFPNGFWHCYRIFEVNFDEFGTEWSDKPKEWKE